MTQKPASRSEILKRNPILNRHWFLRFMAGPIVMGAQFSSVEWRRIRLLLIASPFLLLIFIVNLSLTENLSLTKQILHVVLIVYIVLAIPLLGAAAYGYHQKQQLDTIEGPTADFNNLGRYMMWYAFIGASISTGIGLFGGLK